MRNEVIDKYVSSLPDASKGPQGAVWREFITWLGEKEHSGDNVRKWLDNKRRRGYADGSIAKFFRILRSGFVRNGWEWPFKRGEAPVIREQEVWHPSLSPARVNDMVNVVLGKAQTKGLEPEPQHSAYLALSTIYGLRQVEMMGITTNSLDLKRQLIFIETAKHGRQRYHMIPDCILPELKEWGFHRVMNATVLNNIFHDLMGMVGLEIHDIGWHSIRRSAVMAAKEAGIADNVIEAFYRWKRSGTSMVSRYSTSFQVVGENGADIHTVMGGADQEVDQEVFEKHPFLSYWR